jgi:serine phosphatase RsbU (regulator of sigma subunit)
LICDNEQIGKDLQGQGFEVKHAFDGFDAIKMAVDNPPDIVLIGEVTDGLPGSTTALWLRINPSTSNIPVAAILDSTPEENTGISLSIPFDQDSEKIKENIIRIIEKNSSNATADFASEPISDQPLDIALDLIKIYSERLRLSEAMMELASLQPELNNFEHVVRSVLNTSAKVLGSNLTKVSFLDQRVVYAKVSGHGVSAEDLVSLDEYIAEELLKHLGKKYEFEEELVFGRKKLLKHSIRKNEPRFFGHPILSGGNVIGYLAGIAPEGEDDYSKILGLLPELCSQVSLLVVNARLIDIQEDSVSELTSILRAAVETSSISPVSDVTLKGFLLQFLLIALELCQTTKGCAIILDEESREITEVATLGCVEDEILSSDLSDGRSVKEGIKNLRPDDRIMDYVEICDIKYRRFVTPLATGDKVVGGVIILGFPSIISRRVLNAVKTLASLAASFTYNRTLHLRSIANSILEDQLNIAHEIQKEMLPDVHPTFPGYDIYGKSIPAKEVGGDYFDYLPYGDNTLGIVVADVCGKSIPASLLMAMTRALFIASSNGNSPCDVITTVNSHMVRMISEGRFVTSALAAINKDKIDISMGGHTPILVYRHESKEFDEVLVDGIAMGIVEDVQFAQESITMNSGDVALIYTDGLNEAMDSERSQFGYERIKDILREFSTESAETIVEVLFKAVENHTDGMDQFDDTTIVAIKKINGEEHKHAGN